jgi:RNA polymerase sigma-70 factor (ECF subfamily)
LIPPFNPVGAGFFLALFSDTKSRRQRRGEVSPAEPRNPHRSRKVGGDAKCRAARSIDRSSNICKALILLRRKTIPVSTQTSTAASPLADLIARCALRDEGAFVALYQATSAKLFAVILRIVVQRHWAEDVLQEGYLNVWRHAASYNASRGAPMTWLINIARNQALDFLRRAEHRGVRRETPIEETLPATNAGPESSAETSAELARLKRCLGKLAAAQRRCVLLVHHEGFTPAEAAKYLGVPLGTAKTWVRRGLARLRECLSA